MNKVHLGCRMQRLAQLISDVSEVSARVAGIILSTGSPIACRYICVSTVKA